MSCELVVEPLARALLVAVCVPVALCERTVADHAQLHVGRVDAVGEVGVAIAELLRQVEGAAFCDLARAERGVARQPLEHLGRREQHRLVVAAPLALAAVERRAVPDRDERVLQPRAARVVRVHVAGRDGRHAERRGELRQPRVAADVATFVRTLQLDVERACETRAPAARRRSGRRRRARVRAQPESATSPSACCSSTSSARLGRQQVALLARARVCRRARR